MTTDKSADALTETPKETMDRLTREFAAMSPFEQRCWLMRNAPEPRPVEQHEAAPAGAERAYGVFRTRPDENDGKEFFYHANWHNDYLPQEGERIVEGWFVPASAAQPEPPAADERAAFEAWWVRDVPDQYRADTLRLLRQSRELDGKYGIGNAEHAWEGWQARASSPNAAAEGAKLAVWYGPMPESNGKSNWTAILHKGDISEGITLDRSEYPDRVRYEANRARWLIGEIDKEPWILDYDANKHSGYVDRAPRTDVARGVPDGWKLVPIEPTEEMKSAALRADDRWRQSGDQLLAQWDAMLAAVPQPPSEDVAGAVPIDMLLFCPKCGAQHVDAPETERGRLISSGPNAGRAVAPKVTWENPPHRSHLCHACGTIWRPADVPTNGVASIGTQGKADTWTSADAAAAPAETRELPMMRNAFRVTEVSGDPDPAKQRFAMRFSFPSIDAMYAADDEWNKFIAGAPADAQVPVAWVRKHPDTGELSGDWLWNDAIEQCRKDSGVWFPLGFLTAPPPPAPASAQVPEIDAHREGGEIAESLVHKGEVARSAAPASAPVGLTDEQITEVWNSMPGGYDGFLKSWGYIQFARRIEDLLKGDKQ